MHTYLANKKKRLSTFRFRILRYIYDQQFKKYGIELNEDGKNKVNQLWLESFPQKEAYLKYIKYLCSSYEDVYKISLLMKKNKLTLDIAYEQYVKDNKTKLSKKQWKQLFNIASFEWMEKFAKASDNKKMQMIPNHSMILILQIRLLWEKRLFARNQDVIQTVNMWKTEINALSIKVPNEYLPAKEKALKTLQKLFPLKVDLLKDKNLRPAYKELKRLTNNSDLMDSIWIRLIDAFIPFLGGIYILLLYFKIIPMRKNPAKNEIIYKKYSKLMLVLSILLLLFSLTLILQW